MLLRGASLFVVILAIGCAGVKTDISDSGGDEADMASPGEEPDLSTSGTVDLSGGGGPDLRSVPDLIRLKDWGEVCAADGECTSGLCKPLGVNKAKICVTACRAQADCAKHDGTFCAPIAVDSADGYCIALSPTHCTSCTKDADCGGLTERCLQGPGDIAVACHIDCSIAGADACPPEYTCGTVNDGGKMRKLCLPQPAVCLDALGGYCDRVSTPQACARSNAAGLCNGQRLCLAGSKRYDKCNAMAPQLKMSCAEMDPAGCMLQLAPAVTTTPQNCGMCGNTCPGLGLSNNDVSCVDPAAKKCGMTCRGENYDVDNNPSNGCERNHPTPPGHTQTIAAAAYRGSKSCSDGASTDSFSATLLSDTRVHTNPPVDSFSATVGSAPDFWRVYADGGLCVNDLDVTITTVGGSSANKCYRLTVITNNGPRSVDVSGSGSANISSGSGSYSDDTDIYFKIEKICAAGTPQEAVTYTIRYHL